VNKKGRGDLTSVHQKKQQPVQFSGKSMKKKDINRAQENQRNLGLRNAALWEERLGAKKKFEAEPRGQRI